MNEPVYLQYNKYISNKRKKIYTKFEVSDEERIDLISKYGQEVFFLYAYYLRMCTVPNAPMEDVDVGLFFMWNKRKVADLRRILVKAGYIYKVITKCTTETHMNYYVSPEVVKERKQKNKKIKGVTIQLTEEDS